MRLPVPPLPRGTRAYPEAAKRSRTEQPRPAGNRVVGQEAACGRGGLRADGWRVPQILRQLLQHEDRRRGASPQLSGLVFCAVRETAGSADDEGVEGLQVGDVQLVNFRYEGTFSDPQVRTVNGTPISTQRVEGRNLELVGLLRGEVDAIFLKGASAARQAHEFGLHTVIDTGAHPDPLIRSNNGTPRTLAVDMHLLENNFDVASGILY